MRVIAGQYRSRVLQAPRGLDTRPTSDRLRETLFNVLAPRMEGSVFLDLYAGSGAVGIEALSRGAREAIFVEQAEAANRVIRANLANLGIRGGYALETRSVGAALRRLAERMKWLHAVLSYDNFALDNYLFDCFMTSYVIRS